MTFAEETPALEFLPAGPGPHPVALLAHGSPTSQETLFRYGEALAAAGFICTTWTFRGKSTFIEMAIVRMELFHSQLV